MCTHKYFLIVLLALIGCNLNAQTEHTFQKIEVGYGPEDFELDTFNQRQRLIISCSSRRSTEPKFKEIVVMDLNANKTAVLPRKNEPELFSFSPHGTDLVVVNGVLKLYVVNHPKGNADQILIYRVSDDSLMLERVVESPHFISL